MTSKRERARATFTKLSTDPRCFVENLIFRTPEGKERFGEVLAPHQKEWLDVLCPAFLSLAKGEIPTAQRVWVEGTKGSAKDDLTAALVLWLARFSRRPLTVQVGAADQDQANELVKSAKVWVHFNPKLFAHAGKDVVAINNHKIVGPLVDIEIIATDVASSHGAKPDLLILNEVHAITKWEFCENLLDNASKVPDGLVVVLTNAGFQDTDAWRWREIARTSERWTFLQYAQPAPWISAAELAEAERRCRTRSRFLRLFWGVWPTSGMGDAFDPDQIKRIVRIEEPKQFVREQGWVYVGGLDVGVRRDDTALVIVGKHVGYVEEVVEEDESDKDRYWWLDDCPEAESKQIIHTGTGKLRLVHVAVWKPGDSPTGRVQIENVEREILEIHQRLGLAALDCDSSQTEQLAQGLRKSGLEAEAIAQTSQRQELMAEALFSAFQNDLLDLYEQSELIADLANCQLVESGNRYRLISPKNNKGEGTHHGDTLAGLLNAVFAAKRFFLAQESPLSRPLILN